MTESNITPVTPTTTWGPAKPQAPAEHDPRVFGHYWRNQATIRQQIINKQDKKIAALEQTVAELTASVVQLEDDYDAVEGELKQLKEKPKRGPARVLVL